MGGEGRNGHTFVLFFHRRRRDMRAHNSCAEPSHLPRDAPQPDGEGNSQRVGAEAGLAERP